MNITRGHWEKRSLMFISKRPLIAYNFSSIQNYFNVHWEINAIKSIAFSSKACIYWFKKIHYKNQLRESASFNIFILWV